MHVIEYIYIYIYGPNDAAYTTLTVEGCLVNRDSPVISLRGMFPSPSRTDTWAKRAHKAGVPSTEQVYMAVLMLLLI